MRHALVPVLTVLLLAGGAAGLALRHDAGESAFLELGARYPAVVHIEGLGSGTVVAPHWVLTAAHVPEMITRMRPDAELTVECAGETYAVARVVTPPEREAHPELHDIALLELSEPVPETIEALEPSPRVMEPETPFVLAGWGILAVGDEGVKVTPAVMASPTRALRAGRNAVLRREEESRRFVARFDGPETGLELEAAPCVGDSGGPALVAVEGPDGKQRWQVAGVIAAIDDTDEDGVIGEYGEEFFLTAVSDYADWIRQTLDD